MRESAWFVPAELMGSVWAELDGEPGRPERRAELLGKLKSCRIITAEFPEPIVHFVSEAPEEVK